MKELLMDNLIPVLVSLAIPAITIAIVRVAGKLGVTLDEGRTRAKLEDIADVLLEEGDGIIAEMVASGKPGDADVLKEAKAAAHKHVESKLDEALERERLAKVVKAGIVTGSIVKAAVARRKK